jgi:hypothetical protein
MRTLIRDARTNFTSIAEEKALVALALDDYIESPQSIADFLQIDRRELSAMVQKILTAPPAVG